MRNLKHLIILLPLFLVACGANQDYDATGTFESAEVTLSAEATGRILKMNVDEGTTVKAGDVIADIDSLQLTLQREQLVRQQAALQAGRPDIQRQVAALRAQITSQERELKRIDNMLKEKAATQKQRDDLASQLAITRAKLDATLSSLGQQSSTITENAAALETQIRMLDDRIAKCRITSPIDGTVLMHYAEAGELAVQGKPVCKIANLDKIYLQAYFTSDQLAEIKLGQKVTVIADFGDDQQFEYPGKITWIAGESEFTPKGIQTRSSRANLVYAVKIAVKNDGRLKLGLAGEVRL